MQAGAFGKDLIGDGLHVRRHHEALNVGAIEQDWLHHLQILGQMHVGEAGAFHQGAAAEVGQPFGEDDAVEVSVSTEGVGPDHLERRGQVDAAQVGVLLEGLMVNNAQASNRGLYNYERHETCAPDGNAPLWKLHPLWR